MKSPRTENRQNESMAIETGSSSITGVPLFKDLQSSKFKHHDSGFRSIELADQLTHGKKQFNVNSTTKSLGKYNE